jgi:hypothetical protein
MGVWSLGIGLRVGIIGIRYEGTVINWSVYGLVG